MFSIINFFFNISSFIIGSKHLKFLLGVRFKTVNVGEEYDYEKRVRLVQ